MKARAHGDLSENAEYKYAKANGKVSSPRGWDRLKKRLGDLGDAQPQQYPGMTARGDMARGYGCAMWPRAQRSWSTNW